MTGYLDVRMPALVKGGMLLWRYLGSIDVGNGACEVIPKQVLYTVGMRSSSKELIFSTRRSARCTRSV